MSSFSSIGSGALPLRAAPPPAGTHRWPKQATKGPSTMPAQLESQLLQEHWRITPCCSATGSDSTIRPQTSTLLLLAGSTGSTNAAAPLHCCMICADDVQQIGGGSAVLISPADGAIASPGSHWAELFASAAAVSGVSAPPSSTTFLRDASRIAEATATAAASAATEAIGIGTLTASAAPGSVSSGGGAIVVVLPARAGFTEAPGWRTDQDGILSCKCTIWFGDTL
uniref:Uncharacterized protein n=1 Tax=Anopheles melas TaxID=34690 RepID=A0A182TSX8_9DIPT